MKEVLTLKENVPFTQVANAVLNDKELSWKAKGLFSYIYSKPKGWDFSGHRIANDSCDGRDATYSGIKELETAGYLLRVKGNNGRVEYEISWKKAVWETPEPNTEKPYEGKSLIRETRMLSNKESESNKDKESNNSAATDAAPKPDSFFGKRKKERKDEGVPMNLQQFVLMCRGSQYRHIRLIAEYADEREMSFETRGQWREFGNRNLRAATQLSPYTDRQIAKAMEKLAHDKKENGGFVSKWTMETLIKYLDEI